MKITAVVVVIVGAALAFALRDGSAGTNAMWIRLAIPYVALSAYALYRLYDDGTLLDVLKLRAGDVTIGFLTAAALAGGAWMIRKLFLGSALPASAWFFRIALLLGPLRPSPLLLGTATAFAVLEEIVWRSLVLGALSDQLGTRRAWPVAAGAYALAHVPTAFMLADPGLGPNPLIAAAALGCGLVWSVTTSLTGRLPPVFFSHAAFDYFVLAFFLPRLS